MKVRVRTGIHLEKSYPFLSDLNGAPTPKFVFYVSIRPKGKSVELNSVLRIRDIYPGSQIRIFSIPDSGSRFKKIPDPESGSASKKLSIFNSKNCF
jgi:hypothetical protein